MVAGIFRRTPHTCDAKLTTAAIRIVIGAIHLAPRVAATDLNAPPMSLGMSKRLFDLLLRMPRSAHAAMLVILGFEASVVK
jgi:hypothetical protein